MGADKKWKYWSVCQGLMARSDHTGDIQSVPAPGAINSVEAGRAEDFIKCSIVISAL